MDEERCSIRLKVRSRLSAPVIVREFGTAGHDCAGRE
jgi:hypothetical protein